MKCYLLWGGDPRPLQELWKLTSNKCSACSAKKSRISLRRWFSISASCKLISPGQKGINTVRNGCMYLRRRVFRNKGAEKGNLPEEQPSPRASKDVPWGWIKKPLDRDIAIVTWKPNFITHSSKPKSSFFLVSQTPSWYLGSVVRLLYLDCLALTLLINK